MAPATQPSQIGTLAQASQAPNQDSGTVSDFGAVGISVVASILAVILMSLTKIVWRYFIENYWLRIVHRNVVDVRGLWTSKWKDKRGCTIIERMTLQQYGWKIVGAIEYEIAIADDARNQIDEGSEGRQKGAKQSKERKEMKRFGVEGILRNDFLCLYYWNKDRRQKGCGAFTLEIISQGDTLKGSCGWYDVFAGVIQHNQSTWKRSFSQEEE